MEFLVKALKFALPAIKLLMAGTLTGPVQTWLGDQLIELLTKALAVQATGSAPTFAAAGGIPLPPQSDWHEEGIAAWATANTPPC